VWRSAIFLGLEFFQGWWAQAGSRNKKGEKIPAWIWLSAALSYLKSVSNSRAQGIRTTAIGHSAETVGTVVQP
jgi:hypothetical protein